MLDEYFMNVSRSAIVIRPKQPYIDWLLSHDPTMKLTAEDQEGTIYLLPDFKTRDEKEKWINKHFKELFEEELFGWYTDENMWPQKRTFKMFGEWFNFSLHTMIFDTQKGMIEKI